jgi:hypothetical protein
LDIQMPVTLTLEDVPDEVYTRLESAAKAHHRSVTGEVLARIAEADAVAPSIEEQIEFARKLRERLPSGGFSSDEIVQIIRNDRDSR